jgi:hypothetical protein
MQRKTENTPDNNIYQGAFAFTSPPERVLLSETTNQQDISPFQAKFNVLKFNSANKSAGSLKKQNSIKSQNGSSD